MTDTDSSFGFFLLSNIVLGLVIAIIPLIAFGSAAFYHFKALNFRFGDFLSKIFFIRNKLLLPLLLLLLQAQNRRNFFQVFVFARFDVFYSIIFAWYHVYTYACYYCFMSFHAFFHSSILWLNQLNNLGSCGNSLVFPLRYTRFSSLSSELKVLSF